MKISVKTGRPQKTNTINSQHEGRKEEGTEGGSGREREIDSAM